LTRPIALFALLSIAALAAPPRYADFPPARGEQTLYILRVIDGDTVEAAYLTPRSFRIHGINTRELREPGGQEARKALEAMLPPGSLRQADLRGPDKYGRQLADFKTQDGKWVSLEMIGVSHARPWDGQGPKP